MPPAPNLLEVDSLNVWFPTRTGILQRTTDFIKAVTGVSFTIGPGKTVGLVGESGSGKTTVGKAILKLIPITSGAVRFAGVDITPLSGLEFRSWRRQIQMIFQDPFSSLNPRWTILQIISEPLKIHFPELSRQQREERVAQLLQKVGLLPEHRRRFPHELSGGQRQRVGIARALAVEPKLIVCDEVVSALDVSVQAQIVNLLQDLQDELGLSYLFISHDLAVVEHISHDVVVMFRGQIVEKADAVSIYTHPQHDYTRKLLASVPSLE
ncbi:MAG: ABC transporter ATP-binding protein [Verrucomicrobia bacterium]|nr:ABC transporter ATP-binding protein [Verrucomicrobiota bacterium]